MGLNVVTQEEGSRWQLRFLAVLLGANNRVQGVDDFDYNPGAGLTDMYVQPISLGWTKPQADFTAAYGLFLPVGRYEDGADDNTGLGMFGQELLLGTTVYLNTAAEPARCDGRDVRLLLGKGGRRNEGGQHPQPGGRLRRRLPQGRPHRGTGLFRHLQADGRPVRLAAGVATEPDKNGVWGLGPDLTLALATKQAVYGFVNVRYQWELAARTATEGAAWNILASFPLKPIRLSQP